MEAALIAAIGEAAGSLFNWFSTISNNNALSKETEIQQGVNQTVYYQSLFGYKTAVTVTQAKQIQQGTAAIMILFIVLIIALSMNKRQ